ncbi:MAG: efflux RND transporter periplasmic adaptor subunit [Gemmataceae bacterium]|nr:efflux RND transporter periplasmic adaptor subunit [Gemmataceae bacterium]
MKSTPCRWAAGLIVFVSLAAGCGRNAPQLAPPKPPAVLVAMPITRTVSEHEEFSGRTEASQSVDIRARVTGYLDRVDFKEGADVKAGDPLFQIDPRTYKAEVDRAEANVALAKSRLARLETDLIRAKELLASKAMSQEDYDRVASDRAEAMASVDVARAGQEVARLNLGFTKVVAPVSGRIGRMMIDPGNLVKADDTVLTSIVVWKPMYAYFDIDERTMLRLRRLVQSGKIRSARGNSMPVELGLTDEDGYSLKGTIDFIDNRLIANTGTLRVRGVFDNPTALLSPGLFVRTRINVGDPYSAMMIAEQALSTDQGQKSVFVVDGKNVVQPRKIKVGSLHEGLRVIESGLTATDRVIVSGLQRVRAGVTVEARLVDMPGAGPASPPAANAGGAPAGR